MDRRNRGEGRERNGESREGRKGWREGKKGVAGRLVKPCSSSQLKGRVRIEIAFPAQLTEHSLQR